MRATGAETTVDGSALAPLTTRDDLRTTWLVAIWAVVLLALISRCPSLFTHAQFYAEDGKIWFAQAYAAGWLHAIILPQAGYLNLAPRLTAGIALLFPLQWAPLAMASAGVLVQALPVPILLSARCRAWASLPVRAGLGALYVALPVKEIHVCTTNMQWHLALAALLLAFSSAPQSWRGRVFDCGVYSLAALSGPFSLVLAPLVLAYWWFKRQRWTLAAVAIIGLGALAQYAFLAKGGPRGGVALGASWADFLRMMGGNVVSFAIVGGSAFAWRAPMAAVVVAALLGAAVCLYCFWFASLEWKLFLLFCAGVLAASLRSPLTDGTKPAWDSLVIAVAARYWFFPALAFAWSVLWCAAYGRARPVRIAGQVILLCMVSGVLRDWRYVPYPDENFAGSVERMRNARAGERVAVPILPAGWYMELVKRGDD